MYRFGYLVVFDAYCSCYPSSEPDSGQTAAEAAFKSSCSGEAACRPVGTVAEPRFVLEFKLIVLEFKLIVPEAKLLNVLFIIKFHFGNQKVTDFSQIATTRDGSIDELSWVHSFTIANLHVAMEVDGHDWSRSRLVEHSHFEIAGFLNFKSQRSVVFTFEVGDTLLYLASSIFDR